MTDTQTWPAPSSTPPPPPPAKKSHKKLWIGLGVFALLWVIGAAMGSNTDSSNSTSSDNTGSVSTPDTSTESNNSGSHAASDDVEITGCSSNSVLESLPDVQVEITNHTSKRSNYMVEITLLDSSGNKVGDGIASSNNVEPGQTATEDALATLASGQSFARCHIASVSRYAA